MLVPCLWAGPAAQDGGEAFVVDEVEVVGNQRLTARRILATLGVQPGESVEPRALNEGVHRLWEVLRVAATLETTTDADGRVQLRVEVTELRLPAEVRVVGARHFRGEHLGGLAWREPELGARLLSARYRDAGFLDCTVVASELEREDDRYVVLGVIEGLRAEAPRLHFFGNRRLSDAVLERTALAGDVESMPLAVLELYRERGYLDAKVDVLGPHGGQGAEWELALVVDEGRLYRASSCTAWRLSEGRPGGPLEDDLEHLPWLRPGDPLDARLLERLTNAVEYHYATHGHLEARASVELVFDVDVAAAEVLVGVDTGPAFRMRSVEVRGNESVPEAHILDELRDVRPGSTLDAEALESSVRRIRDSEKIAWCSYEVEETGDPELVDLVLWVSELRAPSFPRMLDLFEREEASRRFAELRWNPDATQPELPADEDLHLYEQAVGHERGGQLRRAVELYEEVELYYPNSVWCQAAILGAARARRRLVAGPELDVSDLRLALQEVERALVYWPEGDLVTEFRTLWAELRGDLARRALARCAYFETRGWNGLARAEAARALDEARAAGDEDLARRARERLSEGG